MQLLLLSAPVALFVLLTTTLQFQAPRVHAAPVTPGCGPGGAADPRCEPAENLMAQAGCAQSPVLEDAVAIRRAVANLPSEGGLCFPDANLDGETTSSDALCVLQWLVNGSVCEPVSPATLLAVGDIASCDGSGDEKVAELMAAEYGAIATLGDTVYEKGSAKEFEECFDPAWGPLKNRIRPAVGNHEYLTKDAKGYFDYFGLAAGDRDKGYYSYELGYWHIIVLNSNCSEVSCAPGSDQEQWLRADLAANPGNCTLAYYHHPRFSSGEHGGVGSNGPLWKALYEGGADVVLHGHDHHYERFAAMDDEGDADSNGMRAFIVGTGGKSLRDASPAAPNSQVRDWSTYGALKLTLRASGYDWQFLPIPGGDFEDSGSADCRND